MTEDGAKMVIGVAIAADSVATAYLTGEPKAILGLAAIVLLYNPFT